LEQSAITGEVNALADRLHMEKDIALMTDDVNDAEELGDGDTW
jgi:hypothetical protein